MHYHLYLINFLGEKKVLSFHKNEYRNLMELIVDQLGEDIGDCKGRAWCGTCHIKQLDGKYESPMDKDEKETLAKLTNKNEASRLACQMLADEKLNGLTFKLLTEDFYGEPN